jgi:diguanylate cyclase (GGDEF)-like protein
MLDIDHFKQINDRYGHDSGDKVLQNMVRLIKGRIRASDCLARWGGEEFVLLLPNTVLSDAVALSNALLEAIRLTAIHDVETVTASFGVACYRLGDSVETILLRADNQMYAAKEAGRNCVRSEDR